MVFLPLIILLVLMVLFFRWVTAKRIGDRFFQWAWLATLTGCFVLFWINGAVGIIGASNNDANMLYYGVLGLGILGGLWVRFRPLGMAVVVLVMGLLMLIIAAIAWMAGWGVAGASWPYDVLILTLFFVGVWVVAAWLFYQSKRREAMSKLR